MKKPASAPDVMPPHELPDPPQPRQESEGTNATTHHPDPSADQRAGQGERKSRSPYVTGND